MKKIISILCACAILFTAFSVTAFGADTNYKPYEESQYFTYGDYDIHYRVIPAQGEQKGRIMMLHGFLCSTYAWRNMVPILNEAGYEIETTKKDDRSWPPNMFIISQTILQISYTFSCKTKNRGLSFNRLLFSYDSLLYLYFTRVFPATSYRKPQSQLPVTVT